MKHLIIISLPTHESNGKDPPLSLAHQFAKLNAPSDNLNSSYEHASWHGALLALDSMADFDFREVDVATIKDSRLLPPTHVQQRFTLPHPSISCVIIENTIINFEKFITSKGIFCWSPQRSRRTSCVSVACLSLACRRHHPAHHAHNSHYQLSFNN